MKKFLYCRAILQGVFLAMVFIGLYGSFRPFLIVFLPLALLAGNYFCGWVCPFGAAQEFLRKAGLLLRLKKFAIPLPIQRYAQYTRYLLIVLLGILSAAQILGPEPFAGNAYLSFFFLAASKPLATMALIVLIVFLVLSLFVDRPFCNYFCTEGVKFALLSAPRLLTIERKAENCIACKRCDKACPMNIGVSNLESVRNIQCINCFKCVAACPVDKTLEYLWTRDYYQKVQKGARHVYGMYLRKLLGK